MRAGERQVAPDVSGIRRDHVARYQWAVKRLPVGLRVLDLACGVGYGTRILANAGYEAQGLDCDEEALAYAREHYAHERASFWRTDAANLQLGEDTFGAAVCFETIEHIEDPLPMLRALRRAAPRLLASVPNEDVFPFRGYAHHFRHYTPGEFAQLLASAGWRVTEWWGQEGPESEVERNCMGRTVIAVAERAEELAESPGAPPRAEAHPSAAVVPEHVVILGLGPSLHAYMDLARRLGARQKLGDEVWAINALGDVFQCDRVFHMDDVRIQEIRAAARPQSNIANMLTWLRRHPGPIYTSQTHPDYPGLVAFPLEAVVNSTGYGYFNNTAAYAVAFAIHLGVKKISVYGCDYTYPNAHDAEKGRGCLEFWLGFAAARGIKLSMPRSTSLLDALEPDARRYYGYDALEIKRQRDDGGQIRFSFVPRPVLPTADEIEHMYDHSRPPNPLVERSGSSEDE